jgi:glycosyltransferase involved in cell wall biosynthesis
VSLERKRLLLVSYLFPPAGGIGVQRVLSWTRYLPALGFDVFVLSASNPSVPTLDPELVKTVPPEVTVVRTWSPEAPYKLRQKLWRGLGGNGRETRAAADQGRSSWVKDAVRRILTPDPEVVWTPGAKWVAARLVREHRIDAVVVSAPPFSSFLVGNYLKRRFAGLRYVADFRDEWLDFYLDAFEYGRHPAIRRRAAWIEAETVRNADLVLSITPSCVRRIRSRYPELPDSRFVCLPNGYDPAMFEGFQPRRRGDGRIRVAHVGTVYPHSTPRYYFDALERLPESLRDRFETHFIGRITPEERRHFAGRALRVVEKGFLPQEQAIREMEEADILLLTMTDPNFTSGKIYEYLATGKPILAVSPPGGEVDAVMRETGAGWLVDPADADAMARCLREAAETFERDGGFAPRAREAAAKYARPRLAEQFAAMLRELLDHAPK